MALKNKVKILYIGLIPPEVGGPSAGGIATHGWQLATQAYKRGYEVYMLGNAASSFTKDGVKVIGMSSPQRNKFLKAFQAIKLWLTINKSRLNTINFLSFTEKSRLLYRTHLFREIINSVKPDLIHIHSLASSETLSLSILKNSPPLVITDHGMGVVCKHKMDEILGFKKEDKLVSQKSLQIADCIICVSKFCEDKLKEVFHFSHDLRIKTILNPLDISKLPLLNKEEVKEELGLGDKKVVFFSGVHKPIKKKGLDILLKAFDIDDYLRGNCKILVVTKGKAITFAHKFVKEKGIDGIILRPQPWGRLVKYYNAADIFVMPSRVEGIGLVYEEALATGVPVVGFSESIEELGGLLGIYIGEKFDASEEDEKDLAEKMINVLNTDFNRELLRRKVVENLTWDTKFNDFEDVYKELLSAVRPKIGPT